MKSRESILNLFSILSNTQSGKITFLRLNCMFGKGIPIQIITQFFILYHALGKW